MLTGRIITNPSTLLALGMLEPPADTFRLEDANGETVFTGKARECVERMHSLCDDLWFNLRIPDAQCNNYGMRICRCLDDDRLI